MTLRRMLWLSWLAACGGGGGSDGPAVQVDADGDEVFTPDDCDDNDPDVYPGAADEWYDGVDSDCAGNDDFDRDGDGHPSDVYGGDDCFDSNPDISPSAPEAHYDGVDNDCNPDTPDTDPDGDGVSAPDDCDDADPDVYPGALEILGDGFDSDCDGGEDTSSFGFGTMDWTLPGSPRVVATNNHVVIGVGALTAFGPTLDPKTGQADAGVAQFFDPLSAGGADPVFDPFVFASDEPLGAVDLAVVGDRVWAGVTYYSETNFYGWLTLTEMQFVPQVGYSRGQVSSLGQVLTDFSAVDVAVDDADVPWLCASDGDSLGYIRGDAPFPSLGGTLEGVDAAAGCVFEPPSGSGPLDITTCDATASCTTWATDPDGPDPTPVPAASQPWSSVSWSAVRERDGVFSVIPDGPGLQIIEASSVVGQEQPPVGQGDALGEAALVNHVQVLGLVDRDVVGRLPRKPVWKLRPCMPYTVLVLCLTNDDLSAGLA